LPEGYADFSHAMAEGPNGHYFLLFGRKRFTRFGEVNVEADRPLVNSL